MTKQDYNDLTYEIIGACIEVHKALGPGLLETVYAKCLAHEFHLQEIPFQKELFIPVEYKGIQVQSDLRCDFLVEDAIVLEIKSKEKVLPIDEAILITYMKLLQKPKGILVNFKCLNLFKEGQKTYVNELFRMLPEN
ncbi:MAG: GxxExxY protein [Chitinophagales bacterium]|nr:GxxExxY protein [Chitinophagales bacterium]